MTTALTADQAPPIEESEVVELPPLIVSGKSNRVPWVYSALPGVEILSQCPDVITRDFARAYQRTVSTLDHFIPREFRHDAPLTLLLYRGEFVEKVVDAIADALRHERGAAGKTQPASVRTFSNLWHHELDAVAAYFLLPDNSYTSAYIQLQPDYIRFLLEDRSPALPPWFIEGFCRVYARTNFNGRCPVIGPIEWISPGESTRLRRNSNAARTLLPMADVFGAFAEPRSQESDDRHRLWMSQADLFIRWAYDPKTPDRLKALWSWLRLCEGEPPSEAGFRRCFGLSYADVRERLSDYLPMAVRQGITLRSDLPRDHPTVSVRPATKTEVARLKGDWERRAVAFVRSRHSALVSFYSGEMQRTFERGLDADSSDPRLLASAGLGALETGEALQAETLLAEAVQANVVQPRAYLELARLRAVKAWTARPGEIPRYSADVAASVIALLKTAQGQSPQLPGIYELAAEIWQRADATMPQPDFAFLAEGVRLFPGRAPLVAAAAGMSARRGDMMRARAWIEKGLNASREPEGTRLLLELRGQLIP